MRGEVRYKVVRGRCVEEGKLEVGLEGRLGGHPADRLVGGTHHPESAQTPQVQGVSLRTPSLHTPATSSGAFQATHTSDKQAINLGVPTALVGLIILWDDSQLR